MSQRISTSRVLVIDDEGKKLGEMNVRDARTIADEKGLDLVEVSAQNGIAVCKIIDEGRWKYEQKKRARKTNTHTPTLKEMKFSMRIDQHDLDIKLDHIKKFIAKGDSVRIIVEMRGREKANPALAEAKLDSIIASLDGTCKSSNKQKGVAKNTLRWSALLRPE